MEAIRETLLKTLVKACRENKLYETINNLLSSDGIDKVRLSLTISALCGVDVPYSESFAADVVSSIKNNKQDNRIVILVKQCSTSCINSSKIPPCQSLCDFDAISVDKLQSTLIIDRNKCISCGFCINACLNDSLIDKSEFVPLYYLLKH